MVVGISVVVVVMVVVVVSVVVVVVEVVVVVVVVEVVVVAVVVVSLDVGFVVVFTIFKAVFNIDGCNMIVPFFFIAVVVVVVDVVVVVVVVVVSGVGVVSGVVGAGGEADAATSRLDSALKNHSGKMDEAFSSCSWNRSVRASTNSFRKISGFFFVIVKGVTSRSIPDSSLSPDSVVLRDSIFTTGSGSASSLSRPKFLISQVQSGGT